MKKIIVAGIAAATALVGIATATSAEAATPSWLHVHTATHATAYNNGTVSVTPSATVSGARVISSKKITAYRGKKRYKSGSSVRLPAGKYTTVTSGTYKTYALVAQRRTRRVLHAGDLTTATCRVTQATDFGLGDGTTDSIATCTNSYYPGQVKSDEEFLSYQVGDTYSETEFFDDQYVTQAYTVRVRKYSAAHGFTSTKRKLTVKNGGYRKLFVGSGIETTNTFRAPGSKWKVSYSWDCSDFGYSGNMIITVYRSNGDYVDVAANRLAMSGTGHSYVHGSGRFYLEMNSECDWRVVVTK